MMQLNQLPEHNSNLFLTQQFVIKEYAKRQMLFDAFKVFTIILFALYATTLHAYNITSKTHEVKKGETLWGIANANNVSECSVLWAKVESSESTWEGGWRQDMKKHSTLLLPLLSQDDIVPTTHKGHKIVK